MTDLVEQMARRDRAKRLAERKAKEDQVTLILFGLVAFTVITGFTYLLLT